jgi:hypothetical protein
MRDEPFTEHGHALDGKDAPDLRLRAQAESDQISDALRERLLNGTLPPDEAYWWTRIAFWDTVARLTDACA